jgi:hypothetical protein
MLPHPTDEEFTVDDHSIAVIDADSLPTWSSSTMCRAKARLGPSSMFTRPNR